MSKSYWLENQEGNFSKKGEDTFDPEKRYIGIRLQQAVPLLDRDWNELEDIRRYEEWKLRKWYVGNGTPDDGFKISSVGPPAKNDFKIKAGRCIVDGFEVVNDEDIRYLKQPDVINLSAPSSDGRADTVYLDIWIEEVTSMEDPALANPRDVNVETCVRHKLKWRVLVDEGSTGHPEKDFHHHYDIAKIRRKAGRDTILDTDIEDLRTTWLAMDLIQNRFKDVINTILKGNLPSDPGVQLVVFEEITGTEGYQLSFEDTKGNIWLFWRADNNIWCKTYRAGRWKADTQLTTGETYKIYLNPFEDAQGNIWLFWRADNNIWCKTYRAGRWKADTQLTTGETYKHYLNAFGDAQGNIWLFWSVGGIIWCKTYRADSWGEETQLTSAGTYTGYRNAFKDADGNIWLFWYAGAGNNIWCKTYHADSWGEETQLTTGETNKIYRNAFEDAHGNIWLFWYAGNNIWCKTYSADSWGEETQLTTVERSRAYRNAFGDAQGHIWLFWYADNNIWCKKTYRTGRWGANTPLITGAESYLTDIKLFEDHEGSIWLLFHKPDYGNIWCKRYVDGDWLAEMRLCSGRTMKPSYDSFEDHEGNIWLFWVEKTGTARSMWCKKCYASL